MPEHSITLVVRAQALHNVGYSKHAISRDLGVPVITVRRWLDPDYAERCRADSRERKRRARSERPAFTLRGCSPEYKLARIQTLHELGLGMTDIGKLIGLDFGEEPWTRARVATALRENRIPRYYRKRVAA